MSLFRRLWLFVGHVEIIMGLLGISMRGAYDMIPEFAISGWGSTVLEYVIIGLLFAGIGHVARRLIEKSVAKDRDRVLSKQFKGFSDILNERFRKVDKNVEASYAVSWRILSRTSGVSESQAKDMVEEWVKDHMAEREQLVKKLRHAVKLFPEALEEPHEDRGRT